MARPNQNDVIEIVARLVQLANKELPRDVEDLLSSCKEREKSLNGRFVLGVLLENARLSRATSLPICQDTGIDTVFVRIGRGLRIDFDIYEAVDHGIARGTKEGFLRSSVCDPITRKNSGNNTPAIVHLELTQGEGLRIDILPKGCGSENMSTLFMLSPSQGIDGIVDAVRQQVLRAGPNPCPPGIIGVGIGGTMEQAAILSKKALLRPVGQPNSRKDVAEIEERIFDAISNLGLGALGLGGICTCLGVSAEIYPCHIASLPVAINIQCHAARRSFAKWNGEGWHLDTEGQSSIARAHVTTSICPPNAKRVQVPISKMDMEGLRAGDWVLMNGHFYTGRDQTHKRLIELLDQGKPLPVDLKGQLIYYVGPSPAPPGHIIGAAGPTTSYRMDAYTPRLLDEGLAATMGKGRRSSETIEALKKHNALYFVTLGGAGAYLSRHIKSCELVAFPELGPEAMYLMEVEDFPAIVVNDCSGHDFFSNTF